MKNMVAKEWKTVVIGMVVVALAGICVWGVLNNMKMSNNNVNYSSIVEWRPLNEKEIDIHNSGVKSVSQVNKEINNIKDDNR